MSISFVGAMSTEAFCVVERILQLSWKACCLRPGAFLTTIELLNVIKLTSFKKYILLFPRLINFLLRRNKLNKLVLLEE